MGMYRSDDGKGWFHLNTGRRASPAACAAPRLPRDDPKFGEKCGRMSDKVCDAPAGQDLAGKPLTCDMPLCEKHATHVDGQNVDYCPRHADLAPAKLPL
jgi:hypothetical protein